MLIELTAAQRHAQEVALPPIFANGFHTDRIDWYARLTVESELVLGGREVIPEFVAAMIGESSLVNRTFGDSNPDPHFGVGWCQLDTGYHVHSLENLLALRADPLASLQYVTDPANGLVRHGAMRTWFKRERWRAWTPEKVDPVDGWNPLYAALAAYDRVTA